jgi:diguanylate cyclase (GGDEF)-like protein
MIDEKSILDTIENGILIVTADLKILSWNRWLVLHTGIDKEEAIDNLLPSLFPATNFNLLKRKVKIALKLGSSTFTNSSVEKFIIPIKLQKITKSIFKHMRQDVVITPLNSEQASIIIYDASPLLEAKAIINDHLQVMEKQATTDTLTGCYNRKMFNDLLKSEYKKSARHNKKFSLVILDIDNFKAVNDTYGHLIGDEVLIELAAIAKETIRESDIFARWGGEEFSVLLPETDLEGGAVLADKMRRNIKAHRFDKVGNLTCSFGVAQFKTEEPRDALISNADWALYHAKNHGKNQVAIFDQGELRTWHMMEHS